jgi:hypothetical protein
MYHGAGFYPEGFGFIARGDGAGGIDFDRDNRYRLAAQALAAIAAQRSQNSC